LVQGKVSLSIGYTNYVLDVQDAVFIADKLAMAEVYETNWTVNAKDQRHHIYANEKSFEMRLIGEGLYQMARLAGKPEKS